MGMVNRKDREYKNKIDHELHICVNRGVVKRHTLPSPNKREKVKEKE